MVFASSVNSTTAIRPRTEGIRVYQWSHYYDRSGARRVLDFIPYSMFTVPMIERHPKIRVIAPRHGGHCGFFHWARKREDPYWAENRIVDFQQERYRST